MDNPHRQALLEQYEEAAMLLLMDEYAEAEGARLLAQFAQAEENGQVSEIPPGLDKQCRRQLRRAFFRQTAAAHMGRLAAGLGRAAVYVAVLLGLSASLVMSVDALRVPAVNFLLEHGGKYATILFDDRQQSQNAPRELPSTGIAYLIPEAYTLIAETTEENGAAYLLYQNDRQEIISIDIVPALGQLSVDAEASEQQAVSINGHEGVFFSGDGFRVIWTDEQAQLTYTVYADNVDEALFWKIVYNLAAWEGR